MITVSEAKSIIQASLRPLAAVRVPLEAATGLLLAEDVTAPSDIPNFIQSSMDGYAIRFSDRDQPLTVIGEMAAGTTELLSIGERQATRIFTGAPLPQGADTVVMQEKVKRDGDLVMIRDERLSAGLNTRAKGSELEKGALGLMTGTLLKPAAIGHLANMGIGEVLARPLPVVSIVVTGNELQQPGQELQPGQVYDSNSACLSAALRLAGVQQIELVQVEDDLDLIQRQLYRALFTSDLVLLTGGISVGDHDHVLEATRQCSVTEGFHMVRQKPGKPLFFGTKDHMAVFGLPGNPASVLSCFYNYVYPAIRLLAGDTWPLQEATAELDQDYRKPAGLTHFVKAAVHRGLVSPLGAQESYRMSSFAMANALLILEQDREEFKRGESMPVLLLP